QELAFDLLKNTEEARLECLQRRPLRALLTKRYEPCAARASQVSPAGRRLDPHLGRHHRTTRRIHLRCSAGWADRRVRRGLPGTDRSQRRRLALAQLDHHPERPHHPLPAETYGDLPPLRHTTAYSDSTT